MRFIYFSVLAAVGAFFLPRVSVSAVTASKQATSTARQCEMAVSQAINVIQGGRDIQVADISTSNLAEIYREYPADSPIGLTLGLDGSDAGYVMSSPQFMRIISTNLINECQGVGLVKFNRYYTDWSESFGLINGSVVSFSDCVQPGVGVLYLDWGQRYCL